MGRLDEALRRASDEVNKSAKYYQHTFEGGRKVLLADASLLSTLRDALAHQPILYCAENEVALTDHERGGCGWCGSCRLDALLEGEDDGHGH